jgi:hypothetical protein
MFAFIFSHRSIFSEKKTGRKTTKQCVFDVEHKNKETTQMASKKNQCSFWFLFKSSNTFNYTIPTIISKEK